VQPGVFWNGSIATGNGSIGKRVLIWLLLALNGIVTFLLFWNFVTGNYIPFVYCGLIFLVLFYLSYRQLIKVNT
jgi:hypothetical protein